MIIWPFPLPLLHRSPVKFHCCIVVFLFDLISSILCVPPFYCSIFGGCCGCAIECLGRGHSYRYHERSESVELTTFSRFGLIADWPRVRVRAALVGSGFGLIGLGSGLELV